jgi:hypothetical protein
MPPDRYPGRFKAAPEHAEPNGDMFADRAKVKGTGFGSSVTFIKKSLADRWPELHASVSPAARTAGESVLASSWVDLALLAEYYTGFARLKGGGDRRMLEESFNGLGRFIAQDNLRTVYRFVLKVLSPSQFLSLLPTLWNTYFQGLEVTVEEEKGRKAGRCTVRGLDRLPYINVAAVGWMEYGFEITGAESHDIRERGWCDGRQTAAALVFDIRWQ